jgi:uncharacterized protein YdcH (DUF465 family)
MKLNNTQIKALAQEVLNKIPETKLKFTKEQTVKFSKIVAEYNKLDKENTALENKMIAIKNNLKESDLFHHYLYGDDIKDIKKLENKLFNPGKPFLEEIIQKITLETIFETKDSMNDFINNLVNQYSK